MTTIYLHPDRLHVTRHTDYNRQIHLQIHEGDTPATIFFSESHAKTLRDELIKLLPPTEPENPPEAEAVPIDDPCPPVVWGPKAEAEAEQAVAPTQTDLEFAVGQLVEELPGGGSDRASAYADILQVCRALQEEIRHEIHT